MTNTSESRMEKAQEIIDAIWCESISDFSKLIGSEEDANLLLDEEQGRSVLSECCRTNLASFVDHLLLMNANAKAVDVSGNTALHIAAYCSDFKIIEKLIGRTPKSVDVPNAIGQTPLMLAAKRCAPDVVGLLIDSGADLNAVDLHGNTALHWSLTERHSLNDFLLTFEKLYRGASDLDLVNADGNSVLDYLKIAKTRWNEYDFPALGDRTFH
jgi:ankyrin repeat protein